MQQDTMELAPEESGCVGDDQLVALSLLHLIHEESGWLLLIQTAFRKELTEHGARTQQVAPGGLLRPQVHPNQT